MCRAVKSVLLLIAVASGVADQLFSSVMFADVAFPISSYQTFTYRIPTELRNQLAVGMRVRAPLGRRNLTGLVVACRQQSDFAGKIRSIKSLVDDLQVMDDHLWELLNWLSRYYLTPIGQVAKTAFPASLTTSYQPPSQLLAAFKSWGSDFETLQKRKPAQARLLQQLADHAERLPVTSLSGLASNPRGLCRKLADQGLVELTEQIKLPDATGFSFAPIDKEIDFSPAQQAILDKISPHLDTGEFHAALLHGVTGSGKTEIYIELVRQVLEQGQTAIMLLPEIALTPQIAGRFRAVFGETVALWHSKLTQSARAWTWRQICAGSFKVVIGARSAIFAPVRNLGLIVVDEEQEQSYKQESPAPRYHARDVALMRGKISGATVLLASATPSLESYYNQLQGKLDYLYLGERYGRASYPQVHVVDMNSEQEETGKAGLVISGLLQDKINQRLGAGEQVILLQNRRGYSPLLRCGDCGEVVMCPHCQLTLTYHRTHDNLQCHFCGFTRRQPPQFCDECQGNDLRLLGTGTQKVEDLLQSTFPAARIARLDLDSTRTGTQLTSTLEAFGQGKIDILLGTQMIAKGLDFENATLVGIINADTGMFLPDFRAGERVFQLVYQSAGRAGRHQKPGEVVVQTYNPDNPVIKQATRLDLKQYYNIALSERQELQYPPFSWIVRMELYGPDNNQVTRGAARVRKSLAAAEKGMEILGPAPCYREKLRNNYRWQIVIKSSKSQDPNGNRLHEYLHRNFPPDRDFKIPGRVRLQIDIDPVSLL